MRKIKNRRDGKLHVWKRHCEICRNLKKLSPIPYDLLIQIWLMMINGQLIFDYTVFRSNKKKMKSSFIKIKTLPIIPSAPPRWLVSRKRTVLRSKAATIFHHIASCPPCPPLSLSLSSFHASSFADRSHTSLPSPEICRRGACSKGSRKRARLGINSAQQFLVQITSRTASVFLATRAVRTRLTKRPPFWSRTSAALSCGARQNKGEKQRRHAMRKHYHFFVVLCAIRVICQLAFPSSDANVPGSNPTMVHKCFHSRTKNQRFPELISLFWELKMSREKVSMISKTTCTL